MKKKIIEIAKFMGYIESPYENTPNKVYTSDLSNSIHWEQLAYERDWNALMSVIDRIKEYILVSDAAKRLVKFTIMIDRSALFNATYECILQMKKDGVVNKT